MVREDGIEPPTYEISARCTATVLLAHGIPEEIRTPDSFVIKLEPTYAPLVKRISRSPAEAEKRGSTPRRRNFPPQGSALIR